MHDRLMLSVSSQTLRVGFGGRQVAVHTSLPRVLSQLGAHFQEMRVAAGDRAAPVCTFEMQRSGLRYTLHVDGAVVLEGVPFRSAYHELRRRVVRALMDARPDLVWLHAGGAVRQGRAVLLAAASGQGKSTLTTGLCQQGWRYLSDDIVPADPEADVMLSFPLLPNVRAQVGMELMDEQVADLRREAVQFAPEVFCRTPVPVAAVVFPAYRFGAPVRLERCPPALASVRLLQRCLNIEVHRGAAVRYIADLVQRVPAFRLTFSDVPPALRLIEQATEEQPLARLSAA